MNIHEENIWGENTKIPHKILYLPFLVIFEPFIIVNYVSM